MLVEAVETPVVEDCKAVRPWKWYDTVLGASLAVLLAGSAAALAVAVADDFGYVTVKRDAFRHAYGAGTHLAVTTPPRGCYGNLGLEFSGSMEDCVVGRLLGDLEGDLKAGGYPGAQVIRLPYTKRMAAYYLTGLSGSETASACSYVTGKWGYYKCDVECR